MKEDIKRQIINLQAKKRRCELSDEVTILANQINKLKRELKNL